MILLPCWNWITTIYKFLDALLKFWNFHKRFVIFFLPFSFINLFVKSFSVFPRFIHALLTGLNSIWMGKNTNACPFLNYYAVLIAYGKCYSLQFSTKLFQ